jgi:hypothetical protein
MSQQNVNTLVECLIGDEEFRLRFARNRIAALHLCGLSLTSDEVAMFVRADVRAWFSDAHAIAGRRH